MQLIDRAMPDFIIQANIARYKELLAGATDARKIAMLQKLLVKEEAKLAYWHADNPKRCSEAALIRGLLPEFGPERAPSAAADDVAFMV